MSPSPSDPARERSVDAQIAAVKTAAAEAQRRQARAVHERDVAQGVVQQATQALAAEFGVETEQAARVKLGELIRQRDLELERVTAELQRAWPGAPA